MIHTIGHSTLDPDEFIARCRSAGVEAIVDVRSHPTSKWPQFQGSTLADPDSWLAAAGISYRWMPELGGWSEEQRSDPQAMQVAAEYGIDLDAYGKGYFPKGHIAQKIEPDPQRPTWTNQGMLDFAHFTTLSSFQIAVTALMDADRRGELKNPALMCAEFVWWKCHRAQVADVLTWKGAKVRHLQPSLTYHHDVIGNRLLRYPDEVRAAWGTRKPLT